MYYNFVIVFSLLTKINMHYHHSIHYLSNKFASNQSLTHSDISQFVWYDTICYIRAGSVSDNARAMKLHIVVANRWGLTLTKFGAVLVTNFEDTHVLVNCTHCIDACCIFYCIICGKCHYDKTCTLCKILHVI